MRTILLIEDDENIREVLQEVLESFEYPVIGVPNGREALTWLRSGEPAPGLLLIDVMMPVMDGLEFLAERERDPALIHIPTVVMSARDHLRENLRGQRIADCLPKPIDIDQLLETVRRHCDSDFKVGVRIDPHLVAPEGDASSGTWIAASST